MGSIIPASEASICLLRSAGLIVVVGAGQHHHLVVFAQTHDPDAGAVAARRDLVDVEPDDDALPGALSTSSTSSTILTAYLIADINGADALAAASGDAVGVDGRPLPFSVTVSTVRGVTVTLPTTSPLASPCAAP